MNDACVSGFHISSLSKMKMTRGKNNVSLCEFLVKCVRENENEEKDGKKSILYVREELKHVCMAAKIEEDALKRDFQHAEKMFKYCQDILSSSSSASYWPAYDLHLKSFIDENLQKFNELYTRFHRIVRVTTELCRYFGDCDMHGWNELFTIFDGFTLDIKVTMTH